MQQELDERLCRVFDPIHVWEDIWYSHGRIYMGDMMCRLQVRSKASQRWDIRPLPDIFARDYPLIARREEAKWQERGFDTRVVYLMDPDRSFSLVQLALQGVALAVAFTAIAVGLLLIMP